MGNRCNFGFLGFLMSALVGGHNSGPPRTPGAGKGKSKPKKNPAGTKMAKQFARRR